MNGDLTTLARVRAYLGIPDSQTDVNAKLSTLITTVSGVALQYLQRDSLLMRARTDQLDGTGSNAIMLRGWPIVDVSAVSINAQSVQASEQVPIGQGFWWDTASPYPPGAPGRVLLAGWTFGRGRGNVSISYTAGYGVVDEAQTVPATPFRVTPDQPYGSICEDFGVTYADGTPLVAVASSPAEGQYVAPKPLIGAGATDYYQFAGADEAAGVLISYSYIPAAIEGVITQWVAEQWAYKDRVGIQSKTLGGQETISYIVNQIPAFVKLGLATYRNVIPL